MPNYNCPKCQSSFSPVAGQSIACPKCGQRFRGSKNTPPSVPPAVPATSVATTPPSFPPIETFRVSLPTSNDTASSPPAPVIDLRGPTTSKWRPQFEPRKYPAMTIIVTALHVLAALTVVEFLITTVFIVVAIFQGGPEQNQSATVAELVAARSVSIFGGVVVIGLSLLLHALSVLMFMAAAESIRIWLHIQENTQEAVFHARLAQFAK